jgi:acyl-CoA synthetase (AMP-forming)/AMP-acid ligase II
MTADATASLVDYLEDAASGGGVVHFMPERDDVRFSDIWRDARRRAGWIRHHLRDESTIAGVMEPSGPCLVTLLGCWLAGRDFASLPRPSRGMDLHVYRVQTAALLELAGTGTLILPADLQGLGVGGREMTYAQLGLGRGEEGTDGARLLQFTSGSTGRPRGVALEMHQLGANIAGFVGRMRYDEADVFCSWLPLSHDMGLVGMCLGSLAAFSTALAGARHLWLSDPGDLIRHPVGWLQACGDVGGTVTMAPNFVLDLFARKLSVAGVSADLSRLRVVGVGSETVTASVLRRFEGAAGRHGFRRQALCPGYGLAEATLAVTVTDADENWRVAPDPDPLDPEQPAEVVALGAPISGVELRIAGDGGYGEIEVRGPSVCRDFLGAAEPLTADGWLRTGDAGFVRDEQLYFVSRSDDRLIVAGRNLNAGHLERSLAGVPGVRAGCCAVISDGAGGFAVVVEPADGGDAAELAHLCRTLTNAAGRATGATPSRVLVVPRGEMPKTPTGKLQRRRLEDRLEGDLVPLAATGGRPRSRGRAGH